MPVIFEGQKRKQQILIFIFIAILIVIGVLVWQSFFKQKEGLVGKEIYVSPLSEIKFNLKILERLKDFSPFEEIQEWTGSVGRENPFVSY